MQATGDKTPIVYRVSNRIRRDVPEHKSSKKRKADEISGNNSEAVRLLGLLEIVEGFIARYFLGTRGPSPQKRPALIIALCG